MEQPTIIAVTFIIGFFIGVIVSGIIGSLAKRDEDKNEKIK